MGINLFKTQTVENMLENVREIFVDPLIGQAGIKRIDIDSYKAKFDGHARAYLFFCNISFPSNISSALNSTSSSLSLNNIVKTLISGGAVGLTSSLTRGLFQTASDAKYLVKSASLPETTVEETSTYFCGRQYKLPSVKRTQDWTVSFYINGDASILKKFMVWSMLMNNNQTYGKPSDFLANQSVQLVGIDGSVICTYNLYGAWPKTLSQVNLDYASNEMATFDVTFTYQYHTISDLDTTSTTSSNILSGVVGMGIDNLVSKLLKR